MFWVLTLNDIKTKIRLRIGHETAIAVQTFKSLVKVVSLAFGSEKKRPPLVKDESDLKAKFGAMFGGRK